MLKAIKVRLYPNKTQATLINKNIGCCRFVYNECLAFKKDLWDTKKESTSKYDDIKRLPNLKTIYPWLKKVDSIALQASIENLQSAYANFFKGAGFPKFKSKKHDVLSYTTKVVGANITVENKHIRLPKLGLVYARGIRSIDGTIKRTTITKTRSGKYICSVIYEAENIKLLPKTNKTTGIDFGLKHFLTLSDGTKIDAPKFKSSKEDVLARLQAKLARKQSTSKAYRELKQYIAKINETIVNQRRDYLHKLSLQIVKDFDIIGIEDLNIKQMMSKDHTTLPTKAEKHFHSNLSDISWSEFMTMLTYKAEWYGKKLIKVDSAFPSSQICSACGNRNYRVKDLSIRQWECIYCNSFHDRDINAAINIEREAIKLSK